MNKTIEDTLFSWGKWDNMDIGAIQFYDCVLNTDFHGKKSGTLYLKGTKIDTIYMDLQHSTLTFYNKDSQELDIFNLRLVVQET